jgi:YesN/AraC family two-component response regulator
LLLERIVFVLTPPPEEFQTFPEGETMHTKTVLLIDDEEPVLLSLGNFLEKNVMRIMTATSGQEALAQLRTTPVDLIITDLVMPGMSGIDVLRQVKKDNPAIGVYILSGQGTIDLAIEALRAGADDFLEKPFDVEALILKMERFFEKQNALKKVSLYEKFIPICMYCKRIRDDFGTAKGEGRWFRPEEYLCRKDGTQLTHSCCPECFAEHYTSWQCD